MMMRVLQISSSDRIGGAALAAHRLHDALNATGEAQSQMFVAIAQAPGPGIVVYDPSHTGVRPGRFAFKVGRRLSRRIHAVDYSAFTLDWTAFGRRLCGKCPPRTSATCTGPPTCSTSACSRR